jgi:hypothetical protein
MPKQLSRSARWGNAVQEARDQFQQVQDASSGLADALEALYDVQSEYRDWLDNLPENLEQSTLGEKLQTVVDIDIESIKDDPLSDWPSLEGTLDEAEGADLPQGYGRD